MYIIETVYFTKSKNTDAHKYGWNLRKCNAELVGSKFSKSCCQKKLLDLELERILSVMYKVH